MSDVESEDGEGHSRKRASEKQGHEQRGQDQDVTAAGGQRGHAREAHPGHRKVGQVQTELTYRVMGAEALVQPCATRVSFQKSQHVAVW